MTILFLGPLPPPVHGFAAINVAMLERLRAVTTVLVFDRSPGTLGRGWLRHVRLCLRTLVQLWRFAWVLLTQRPTSLYVGFSGGFGQIIDLPFLLLARTASLSIFLHHHSFEYLLRRRRRTQVCFTAVPNAVHIILCSEMAKCLHQLYGIDREKFYELSNSGFLASRPIGGIRKRGVSGMCIGFLSNISTEKGIFRFFEVASLAQKAVPGLQTLIAGPLDPSIQERFFKILGQMSDIRYLGSVHRAEKEAFYESIDLLLFPSSYVNEAEPVTILEALASGVEVIAANRGCIPGMIPRMCGKAVNPEDFSSVAVARLIELSNVSPEALVCRRRSIATQSFQAWQINLDRLSAVVENITGIAPQPTVKIHHG